MRIALATASLLSILVLSPAAARANNNNNKSLSTSSITGGSTLQTTRHVGLLQRFHNSGQALKLAGKAKSSSEYARTTTTDANKILSRNDIPESYKSHIEQNAEDSHKQARTDNLYLVRTTESLQHDLGETAHGYVMTAKKTNDHSEAHHLRMIAKDLRGIARRVKSAYKNYDKAHLAHESPGGYLSTDVANEAHKASNNAYRSLTMAHEALGKLVIGSLDHESKQSTPQQ